MSLKFLNVSKVKLRDLNALIRIFGNLNSESNYLRNTYSLCEKSLSGKFVKSILIVSIHRNFSFTRDPMLKWGARQE